MGREFAKVLSYAGASIVLADVNKEVCQDVAATVSKETKGKIFGVHCDISRKKDVETLFSSVSASLSGLSSATMQPELSSLSNATMQLQLAPEGDPPPLPHHLDNSLDLEDL